MPDDLTQQPTDIPQDSQSPSLSTETPVKVEIPETPQEPQPIETPLTQEPIAQPSPAIPATKEPPVISSEPPSPPNPPNPPVQPISIPKLRFPFNGNFPLTFSFGAQPTTNEMKQKFSEWGISGHHGLDFALSQGTEVLAVDSGKIIQCGDNADFGISVTIQHPWGQSLYAHLQEAKVSVDQNVNSGDVIGLSGQTGSAFGQHLHFGIKPNNPDPNNGYLGFVDPVPYLPLISPIPPITPISEEKPTESSQPEPIKFVQSDQLDQSFPISEPSQSPLPAEASAQAGQMPETPQQPEADVSVEVLTEAEIDRRAQEKLLAELEVRRQKANQARQSKKDNNLTKIEKLIAEKGKINNDDVRDHLHVSQTSATRYLETLVNQGKIKTEGKGRATIYKSMLS